MPDVVPGLKEAGLEEEVEVRGVGCMRLCCEGPLVAVEPQNLLYQQVAPEDAPAIVGALKGGSCNAKQGDLNAPFFQRQMAIVLENSGRIDPDRPGAKAGLHRVRVRIVPHVGLQADAPRIDDQTAAGGAHAAVAVREAQMNP